MHYDLIVIGSGSGNSLLTPYWDDKRVAIVESGVFGGTCLNKGCIPTKMFVLPSTFGAAPEEASRLGVSLQRTAVDWPGIRDRIFGRVDAISASGRSYRADELENVDLIEEEAHFTGQHELTTTSGRVLTADKIVIAAGSRAVLPDVPGVDTPGVHTSDTVMRLARLPKRIVIVGGGYIAAEFAGIFSGLGSEVIQVIRGQQLLRHGDSTVAERFTAAAMKRWELHRGWQLTSLGTGADADVEVRFTRGDETLALGADVVLLATGRVPNSDRVGAASVGFDLTADQRVSVDDYQRVLSDGTPVSGVFALGDVCNPYQLKHVANRETRVVAHNLERPANLRATDHRAVPAAVFARPQVATVGLTEQEARERAENPDDIAVAVQDYGSTAYGWALEDQEGFVKLIAQRSTGKILGAHLMGEQASILIQPLVQAMVFDQDAYALARTPYWIHPALTEVVENALLSLETQHLDDAAL
ncbi:MAG: mycothione reductase [Galactobacter sp.]